MSSVSYNVKRNIHPSYGRLLYAVSTIDPREIGQRIAVARNRKGLTQLDLAYKASVSPSSIQRWEAGRLPPVRELIRIAGLLEIDPEELVETAPAPTDLEAVLARLEEVHQEVREIRALVESALGDPQPATTSKRRVRSAG